MDSKEMHLMKENFKRLVIYNLNITDSERNITQLMNVTDFFGSLKQEKDIFNSLPVEIFLFAIYSFVFIICFIGNSLVIAVLALNRETQTATNFFLLNLAVADLCVALFCVYQNLSVYIFSEWSFGDLLCRMYHFVHALSYTASVYILVVISIERYLALVYPLMSRRLLTMKKLKITILIVWLLSAICCFPRFIIFGTVDIDLGLGSKTLCVLKQKIYDAKLYDVCYIILCFIIPLIIISVSYLRVCYHLYTSPLPGYSLQANRARSCRANGNHVGCGGCSGDDSLSETSIKLILERRKKVIKLLITIVLAFAVFSAPFHARKLAQHFIKSYKVNSNYATMFTIFTTLLLYSNSGINPLIYLIFSKRLRGLMIDAVIRLLNKTHMCNSYQNRLAQMIEGQNQVYSNILLPVNSGSDNRVVNHSKKIENSIINNNNKVMGDDDHEISNSIGSRSSKQTDV